MPFQLLTLAEPGACHSSSYRIYFDTGTRYRHAERAEKPHYDHIFATQLQVEMQYIHVLANEVAYEAQSLLSWMIHLIDMGSTAVDRTK